MRVDTVAAFAARAENVLQEGRVYLPFELRDSFLVAVIVGIDVHQAIQRVTSFLHLSRGEVEIEKPHQRVKVLGLAIQLLVNARHGLGQGNGGGIGRRQPVQLRGKLCFLARFPHRFFDLPEKRHGFLIFPRADVPAGNLEKLSKAVGFLLVICLENLLRPVQPPRSQQPFAEQRQERRVLFARRKRFEQCDGPFGVALSKLRFREQERAGAVLGGYSVSAPEIFGRQIQASGSQRQLAGPQETASGKVGMAEFFRQFAQSRVPVRILGIEKRDAFAAGQGFDIAPMLMEDVDGGAKLLDRLRDAVLLLQQRGIAHEPVRGLREWPQESRENRRGLGGIAGLDQPVELRPVILGRHGRLIEPRVDIGERLQRLRVRGHFLERGLILGNRLAQLVLLKASPRPL